MLPQFLLSCQFQRGLFLLLALVFLGSCSLLLQHEKQNIPNAEEDEKEVSIPVKETWFTGPVHFLFIDEEGQIPEHPFFDFDNKGAVSDQLLYYPLTTLSSPYAYDFDLKSGRPYRVLRFCEQKDVWKNYKKNIFLPPYSEGVLPRFLDEQGGPQRVFVFGKNSRTEEGESSLLQPVRIVGGLYEQFCRNYPCLQRETWTTRLILVGVDPRDEEFSSIRDLSQLKKIVDWDYAKAFMQNGRGRTLSTAGDAPAFRIVGELENQEKATKSSFERGHNFTTAELQRLKNSCQHIYDSIYSSVKKVREKIKREGIVDPKMNKGIITWEDETPKSLNYLKKMETLYRIPDRNVWKAGDDLLAEVEKIEQEEKKEKDKVLQQILNEQKKSFNLGTYFKHIVEKYQHSFNTCDRYVRSNNINDDYDRHNFFVYFSSTMTLFRMGYFYNCSQRAWAENLIGNDGKYLIDPIQELEKCTSLDVDTAFSQSLLLLVGRAKIARDYYSYLEYDNGPGGSHKKIYSWVYQQGKKMSCLDSKDMEIQDSLLLPGMPEDVKWTPFIPREK